MAHLVATSREQQAIKPARLDALRTTIGKFEKKVLDSLKADDTPGLAVGIFTQDEIHYLKGFGITRRDFPSPVTPTTLFQLASVSKPICATALAILKEKGLFGSYKDHPNHYLPEFFIGEAYKNLKVENILNHTSGITYEGFEELIESYIPRQEILKKLNQTPVSAVPGEQFEYNNVVYGLIGDIMTNVTQKPLETVLKEHLFKPLGMDGACIGLPALLEACDRFYPHMEDPVGNAQGQLIAAPHYSHAYYIFPTSAGVNACVKDLISFIQLYLGRFPEIISNEALTPLLNPTTKAYKSLEYLGMPSQGTIKEAWYGLGWLLLNIGQDRVVYHTGYLNGVRNFIGFLPDHGIGIVLLANTERMVASRLGLEFFHFCLEAQG